MPRVSFDPKITFGNVLTILGMALLAAGIWYGLVARVDATGASLGELKPAVVTLQTSTTGALQTLRDADASFNTRLTVVESRAETQALKMTEMAKAIEQLTVTVNALNTTTETTKTDVGYIRRWVEDLKRGTQAN